MSQEEKHVTCQMTVTAETMTVEPRASHLRKQIPMDRYNATTAKKWDTMQLHAQTEQEQDNKEIQLQL